MSVYFPPPRSHAERGKTRARLFDYFAGRGSRRQREAIEYVLGALEQRTPHLHRALTDAHVLGHRDVDWQEEEAAVDFVTALLSDERRRAA